jgi:acetyl esterase/lipase
MRKRATVLLIAALVTFTVCASSPKQAVPVDPVTYQVTRVTRWLFSLFPFNMAQDYPQLKENVEIIGDIDYQSAYPNGYLDIIRPKTTGGAEKIIFFTHGGGFIDGDKKEVEHYFVHLANDGFVTVNINYALAPEHASYPMPVKQIEEAYTFIKDHATEYNLNLDHVYFGGDSAGGHIIAQFVTMQTSDEYLSLMNSSTPIQFSKVVERSALRGVLFFCALFDMAEMAKPPPDAMILPVRRISQAYFRTSDMKSSMVANASVFDKVTSNFPRTFITDGNRYSLEWQAKKFEAALRSRGVEVESVFFKKTTAPLNHEYQFNMDDPHALQTYEKVVVFLNN